MTQTLSDDVTEAAYDWLGVLKAGGVSAADRRAFETWLAADLRHEEAFERAQTLWDACDGLEPGDIDPDLIHDARAPTRIREGLLFGAGMRPLAWGLAAACALISAVLIFGGTLRPTIPGPGDLVVQSTGIGETVMLTLADGTVATLGAQTEIGIGFSENARWVVLRRGAAYFDIAADAARPFRVQAQDLTAEALGTVYEMRNNGGVARVSVAEGQVAVHRPYQVLGLSLPFDQTERLAPGDRIAALGDGDATRLSPVAPDQIAIWRENRLVYDGAPLREVIADANRYHATPIRIAEGSGIGEMVITAGFAAGEIEIMLSVLQRILPIEIDRSAVQSSGEGGIIIRRAPAQ
ncbi:MAG: FecR domain-containing protein [Pseudomonadota bacterium]